MERAWVVLVAGGGVVGEEGERAGGRAEGGDFGSREEGGLGGGGELRPRDVTEAYGATVEGDAGAFWGRGKRGGWKGGVLIGDAPFGIGVNSPLIPLRSNWRGLTGRRFV